MTPRHVRRQVRKSAKAACAAWQHLLSQWNPDEIRDYDSVRRLMVRAVAWAQGVGENGARVDTLAALRLMTEIERLSWPPKCEPMRQAIRHCAQLALSLAAVQRPPKISELDLHKISDGARILLTVRGAERAVLRLPVRGVSAAHRAALDAAIGWARSIGEGRQKLGIGADGKYVQAIAALTWKGRGVHVANSVLGCRRTAGNPWIWEASQSRYQPLVSEVNLQHAVLAGVKQANIGRDYLKLQPLKAPACE